MRFTKRRVRQFQRLLPRHLRLVRLVWLNCRPVSPGGRDDWLRTVFSADQLRIMQTSSGRASLSAGGPPSQGLGQVSIDTRPMNTSADTRGRLDPGQCMWPYVYVLTIGG